MRIKEKVSNFFEKFKNKKIFSFEASFDNFNNLKKFKNKNNLILENLALSSEETEKKFNQCKETSSSTFSEINVDSKYFKKN